MVHNTRSDFKIIPEILHMGINVLGLMEECLSIGNWGEVMDFLVTHIANKICYTRFGA